LQRFSEAFDLVRAALMILWTIIEEILVIGDEKEF